MKIVKKMSAVLAGLGLAVAGMTAVSSMSDVTTPTAEAASCLVAYSDFRHGGYAQNISCSPFVVYHETRSVGKTKRTYYANKARVSYTSSFRVCYAMTLWSGWYRGR